MEERKMIKEVVERWNTATHDANVYHRLIQEEHTLSRAINLSGCQQKAMDCIWFISKLTNKSYEFVDAVLNDGIGNGIQWTVTKLLNNNCVSCKHFEQHFETDGKTRKLYGDCKMKGLKVFNNEVRTCFEGK